MPINQGAVLIVGGAGYIGSHMVTSLLQAGLVPVVLDNLSTGHQSPAGNVTHIIGDIHDTGLLEKLFSCYHFAAVMHFAALIAVGESVANPLKYYHNNVAGTLNLLRVMLKAEVNYFIFSSSAAVYGNPNYTPIDEQHPLAPVNPYGHGKKMVEQMLQDLAVSQGLKFAALRYFNAAGLHEQHHPETHLIPLIFQVVQGERDSVTVFGTDYSTADGTCIRDYVHVQDICAAHLLVLQALWAGKENRIYNIGTGYGYSVKQVIETVRAVTGHNIPSVNAPRRAGDPAVLVADATAITHDLGWQPEYSALEFIIEQVWDGLYKSPPKKKQGIIQSHI
jgi:UDP-glucose 4-epimerase